MGKKKARKLWEQKQPKPDWERLERVKESLLREFDPEGVVHARFVVAFSQPFCYSVWLGTSTDQERATLQRDATVDDRIRNVAVKHGMADLYDGFQIESQETVDRDYEGSWFRRLR